MSEHEHDQPAQGADKKPRGSFLDRYSEGPAPISEETRQALEAALGPRDQPLPPPEMPSAPGLDALWRIEEKLDQVIDLLRRLLEKQGQKGE
jgi:hypothetical protein